MGRNTLFGIGLVVIATTLASLHPLARAKDDPEAQGAASPEVQKLMVDQLQAARKLVEATRAWYSTGSTTIENVISAHQEQLVAELQVAESDQQRKEAHLALVEALRTEEQRVQKLFELNAAGGEAPSLYRIKTARIKAEVALKSLRPSILPK